MDAGTADAIEAKLALQPRRRPGRPRLSEMTENRGDEEIVKKVRQRIAQRSYRSRKQGALVLAEARASRLEGSLNKALQSFAQFQDYIIQKGPASLPPDILLHLSKTAVKLTTMVNRHMQQTCYNLPLQRFLGHFCRGLTQTKLL